MKDLESLAQRMRGDWDRRVRHDYRFWMSDGHASDAAMWESGRRDFELLCGSIPAPGEKTLLEIGCGVGRLLRAASEEFRFAHGIDISGEAIAKARELLGDRRNVELHVGNGVDLAAIGDATIDVVVSFAAITSMPTDVISAYLLEMRRVVKPDGLVRLQLYLGSEQQVGKHDTLHLRCYPEENFRAGALAAGFDLSETEELKLPFQVSFEELGIRAMLATLRPVPTKPLSRDDVSACLLPGGETEVMESEVSLEYWMTLSYAKDLLEKGEHEAARRALEFAKERSPGGGDEAAQLLQTLRAETHADAAQPAPAAASPRTEPSPESRRENHEIVARRFPEVAGILGGADAVERMRLAEQVEVRDSAEGPVVWRRGQCLDHPTRPLAGADAWVKRMLNEKRFLDCEEVVIVGVGNGYHLDALVKTLPADFAEPIVVIEPNPAVLGAALETRSHALWLERVSALAVGEMAHKVKFKGDSELFVRPMTQAIDGAVIEQLKGSFYGTRGFQSLSPRIAVLGPMQGGTLPMTAYVTRALFALQQRTREMDMSGFAQAYHVFASMLKDKVRQTVLQNQYIETLSAAVVESIKEKPVDVLLCMAQAPISGRALDEIRNMGVVTALWFVEDYLRFSYWKEMSRYYDFVFTIQKGECIEKIKAAGAGEVHYVPVGCDPDIHRPIALSDEEKARWGSPISFVGAGYHNRQQMFASLADYPFKIWGTEWPECRPFDRLVQEKGRRLTPDEYVRIFNATTINVNLHSSSERDGVDPAGDFVNPRTFELAAAGAFQLVDARKHLPEVFTPGKDLAVFHDARELKGMIEHYLEHPEERQAMTASARDRALREHSYQARIKSMLELIYRSRYDQLKQRERTSPWVKMIQLAALDPELKSRCEAAYKRGEEPILDGLVADIVSGKGKLTTTEQKLMFLFHVRKQIINMRTEEGA